MTTLVETLFDPRTTPTDQMGITAELFWRQPGVAARLFSSRAVVERAVAALRDDPLRFLCAVSQRCDECDTARASVLPLRAG